MKLFRKIKKGFTLVELVVVIAVIAILAAVSVGAYFGVTESANATKLQTEAKQIYTSIQLIGNSNSDNHQLDENGLHIVDTKTFEDELSDMVGSEVAVYTSDAANVYGDAIILSQNTTNPLAGATTYTSFKYVTPSTGNKAASVDVVTGEVTASTVSIKISDTLKTKEDVIKAIEKAEQDLTKPATLIKFGSNILFDDCLQIQNRNVILDLNGYTISAKYVKGITYIDGVATQDTQVVIAEGNSKVVITGDGKVTGYNSFSGDEEVDYGVSLIGCYPNSEIIIENGTFITDPVEGVSTLYSKGSLKFEYENNKPKLTGEKEAKSGKITVLDGSFCSTTPYGQTHYTLNIRAEAHDENDKEFDIQGGRFFKRNPEAYPYNNPYVSDDETVYINYVNSNSECEQVGDWFVVSAK